MSAFQYSVAFRKKKGINATLSALEVVCRVHKMPFLSEALPEIFTELKLQVVYTLGFFKDKIKLFQFGGSFHANGFGITTGSLFPPSRDIRFLSLHPCC